MTTNVVDLPVKPAPISFIGGAIFDVGGTPVSHSNRVFPYYVELATLLTPTRARPSFSPEQGDKRGGATRLPFYSLGLI